jgi:hypothetical protein
MIVSFVRHPIILKAIQGCSDKECCLRPVSVKVIHGLQAQVEHGTLEHS